MICAVVDEPFLSVIQAEADKRGLTIQAALVQLAIEGMECQRRHTNQEAGK